jgi:EAL domain-containing protein (putative c-di-GMP-specific phosphodiesterase class I)
VNVSVYQFQHAAFPDQVARILDETGVPPELLELEVTESLLMDDPDRVTEIMRRLRELGIRFSLDDFGTGYSSLTYLKRLPLDQIKIDQSFTRDLGENSASGAIVDSIIGLSSGLELQVIAEGVETEEQREWLVEHGCRHFQGYLFGRPGPLPADN